MAVELMAHAIGWAVRFSQTHDGNVLWSVSVRMPDHTGIALKIPWSGSDRARSRNHFFGAGLDDCLPIFDSESDLWPTISVQLKE